MGCKKRKRMKKILIFGFTDKRGGIESFLIEFIKHMDASFFSFDCIANTDTVAYEDELMKLGVNIYHIPMRSQAPFLFRQKIKNFFKLNSKKYDAIWVNVCSLANIDYLIYAKKYGIPKRIIHCHNSQNMDSKIRGLLHYSNRLRISKYATDYWTCSEKASIWFYGKKIMRDSSYFVFNNSVDPNRFQYNQQIRELTRKHYNVSENTTVIGNVGRLHAQKNQSFLIDVFYRYHQINHNSQLWIIGQGELKDHLMEKVESLALTKNVVFYGEVDNVDALYQGMDYFAFPSLYEGMSIALLEAEANGLTCLISSGNPEDSVLNENVFRINSFDKDLWCQKLLESSSCRVSNEHNNLIGSEHDINVQIKKIKELFK